MSFLWCTVFVLFYVCVWLCAYLVTEINDDVYSASAFAWQQSDYFCCSFDATLRIHVRDVSRILHHFSHIHALLHTFFWYNIRPQVVARFRPRGFFWLPPSVSQILSFLSLFLLQKDESFADILKIVCQKSTEGTLCCLIFSRQSVSGLSNAALIRYATTAFVKICVLNLKIIFIGNKI